MRLDELFPFWGPAHEQLLEMVEYLSEGQFDYRPLGRRAFGTSCVARSAPSGSGSVPCRGLRRLPAQLETNSARGRRWSKG